MPTFRAGIAPRFDDLRDEFDRLWNSLAAGTQQPDWSAGPAAPERSFPAVNVTESDEALVIEAELPGLAAGDVETSVFGDELVIRGVRPGRTEPAKGNGEKAPGVIWHRRERRSGEFERRIELPMPIDAARVEARLVDGLLTVTCPKAAEARPRKIEVRTA